MYPPSSSSKFLLSAFLLAVTAWPALAQSVMVLPDSATGGSNFPFTNSITGDFSSGQQITSGTTTLAEALTFGVLPFGGSDSHPLSRFETAATRAPVTYGFALPRNLSGLLLWNYNEIFQGVLYNERGVTRADITVTHTGGTTVFNDVAFTQTPESGGAAQLATAQQFNFGNTITGVLQITLGDLQGAPIHLGWMDFAAIQSGTTVPLVQKYWDGSSFDGNANGGGGTWNTTTTNWDSAETAGTDTSWPQGGNAVFKGNFNGLVTLGEAITANTLTFDLAGYVISGNTLTIAGPQATVTANQTATISSALGGSAAVVKTGTGLLTLNGDGSAFTGSLSNVGGSMRITSPNWNSASFSPVGGVLTFDNGGTLTVGSLTLGNAVAINNGTRLNIAGGTLSQAGTGGSVSTAAGAAGSITSSSGTLTINAPITNAQTMGVALADFDGTTPLTLVLDGPGGNQVGNIVLSATSSYTGGTTLNSGRLNVSNAAALGSGTVSINQDGQAYLTVAGPILNDFNLAGTGWQETAGQLGALRLGNTTISGDLTIDAAGARVVASAGNAAILSGGLLGSGNLEINIAANASANGTLTFTGDGSTYSGTATVSAGRLNVEGTFGSSSTVAVGDTGTLGGEGSIAGDLTLGVSGGATLAVNASTPGVLSAGDVTLNGVTTLAVQGSVSGGVPIPLLTHTGALTDANGGTLADSFSLAGYRTPVVNDNSGTLELTVAGENIVWTRTTDSTWETGGPSSNWNSSDTFFFNGDGVTFDDTATDGSITVVGTPQPSSVTFNNSDSFAYFLAGGAIGGTGNLTKNNNGLVTLALPLTLTGSVTVNGGLLQVNSSMRNVAGITVNAGGVLETSAVNTFVVDHNAPLPNSQVITINGGQWSITANHDARFGNVTLANGATWISERGLDDYDALMANTNTGPATLTVTGTGPSFMVGSGGIHLQGIQNFDIADTTGNSDADLVVNMILAGPGLTLGAAGGVNKTGAGTMLLNGSNTYLGVTTVAAGTLGGSGSVTSPVTVNASAALAPGEGVGSFSVTGNATIDGTLAIEVDGATSDQLLVTGTLDLEGSKLAFSQLNAPTETSYVIATAASIVGMPSVSGLPAGYEVNISATQITLEPVGTGTPFENWIDNFTELADPDKLATADPDKDGTNNLAEFAFAGDPTDPSDNGKVFLVMGDGADPGTAPQLILTLAVRKGATFGAPPSPSASLDGVIYTIQGSLNLSSFNAAVSTMSAAIPPPSQPLLPDEGWEWRSFSLNGSSNFPSKGFMRAITEATP